MAVVVWISRTIPVLLIAVIGYSIFVVAYSVSIQTLLHSRPAAAIAIITLFFVLLLPLLSCFFRLLQTMIDPGYLPRNPGDPELICEKPRAPRLTCTLSRNNEWDDTKGLNRTAILEGTCPPPEGIERFYAKDAFICDHTGLPLYCDRGCNGWKPARAHHCREVNRCVRRMDHFCPWVGGVVAERNTKFFIQFCFYASIFCAFVFGVVLWTIVDQIHQSHFNGHWIAICACAGLFLFMAAGLFLTTTFQNQMRNQTTVESLGRVDFVAVFLPSGMLGDTPSPKQPMSIITYPLPLEGRSNQPKRTFAVIECGMRDNLWDLGSLANLKSVLGERYIDWILPIKHSPCCSRDGEDFDYPFGAILEKRKREHGLLA